MDNTQLTNQAERTRRKGELTMDGAIGMASTDWRKDLEDAARVVVRAAAACAAFCEHVEHNEPIMTTDVRSAAEALRGTASRLASRSELSLQTLYVNRIRSVEESSLLRFPLTFGQSVLAGADALIHAQTWAQVQVAQSTHDRQFHPDVFGLSKIDQLRHYTFHVTKLAGLIIDAIDDDEWRAFSESRLADLAIFGVKLSTVCNEKLSSDPLDLDSLTINGSADSCVTASADVKR